MFAVILTAMLWFWLDADVFALLQCLLLVVVVTGRTAHSIHETPENLSLLELPFALARDVDTFARYNSMSQSLAKISRTLDPIYRELALESLDDTNRRIHTLADGLLIFEGTETWRLVYERLLRSPGLYQYRSVAWIQSAAYWQDEQARTIRFRLLFDFNSVAAAEDRWNRLAVPYFEEFLKHGFESWPDSYQDRFPDLKPWPGVRGLKKSLRQLAGAPDD